MKTLFARFVFTLLIVSLVANTARSNAIGGSSDTSASLIRNRFEPFSQEAISAPAIEVLTDLERTNNVPTRQKEAALARAADNPQKLFVFDRVIQWWRWVPTPMIAGGSGEDDGSGKSQMGRFPDELINAFLTKQAKSKQMPTLGSLISWLEREPIIRWIKGTPLETMYSPAWFGARDGHFDSSRFRIKAQGRHHLGQLITVGSDVTIEERRDSDGRPFDRFHQALESKPSDEIIIGAVQALSDRDPAQRVVLGHIRDELASMGFSVGQSFLIERVQANPRLRAALESTLERAKRTPKEPDPSGERGKFIWNFSFFAAGIGFIALAIWSGTLVFGSPKARVARLGSAA